jgi:hypothetical protein
MAGGLGSRQVVHYHFGRANNLRSFPIATLNHLEDGMVGLGWIMALRKCFMLVRVEQLAHDFLTLDAVLPEQLLQLFQRHLHTLMKLRGVARGASANARSRLSMTGNNSTMKDSFCATARASLSRRLRFLKLSKSAANLRCKSLCSARSFRSASDSLAAVSTL